MSKKILISSIIIALVIILGSLLYKRVTTPTSSENSNPLTADYTQQRIGAVESAVEDLAKQVADLKQAALASGSGSVVGTPLNFDIRIQNLEQAVSIIQAQLKTIPIASSSSNSNSNSNSVTSPTKSPEYIPLGSTDPLNDQNWRSISSVSVSLNSNDYPGYSGVTFEASLRLNSGTGVANAKILGIDSSIISTSSTTFVTLSSSPFKLLSGRNTYTVATLSSLGDTMFLQNARLKISF